MVSARANCERESMGRTFLRFGSSSRTGRLFSGVRSGNGGTDSVCREAQRFKAVLEVKLAIALTRARRFLLVVGDSATLGEHPYYAAMVTAMDELGAHGSAWADDGDPLA